ncbi:hypothetical protein [Acinetobacter sp.]|uniref:hypothetical protein n=1 Tax=Acinetobacter sp. TaxID=472 RepID=UPI00388CFA2A
MLEGFGIFPNFPDGTILTDDLPSDLRAQLRGMADAEGILSANAGPVYGNYLMFAGYKVKVKIVEATDKTYKVQLV